MARDGSNQVTLEAAPERLASHFLRDFFERGNYARDTLSRLIDLAISEDRETAGPASRAFFASLVERLADSFEPDSVAIYNRLFAQLLGRTRATAAGRALDRLLNEFNLRSEAEIAARAETLRLARERKWTGEAKQAVRRAVVLSRVTLGADVAITSVMIERVKLEFPNAEIMLAGGRKAAELFGGDRRLTFKQIDYGRAGTVMERLLSWPEVVRRVAESIEGLSPGEYVVIDPDSRLTQLGLLPVAAGAPDDYLFFPSREYGAGSSDALGELVARWLDEIFGEPVAVYPQVYLDDRDLGAARAIFKRMRGGNRRPIVTINFGVGENPQKRVGGYFEASLVSRLIKEGAMVILDRGAGEEESGRADAIIKEAGTLNIEGRPARVIETDEETIPRLLASDAVGADLLVWDGRVGLLAALISESDLYAGYDSAGQHIAAALGVRSINVFAGYNSQRMLDRWRPVGRRETRVISVQGTESEGETLSRALGHAAEMLRS